VLRSEKELKWREDYSRYAAINALILQIWDRLMHCAREVTLEVLKAFVTTIR